MRTYELKKGNRVSCSKKCNWKTQIGYYAMFAIPALWMFVFSYLPMSGVYLAFTDYKPAKGVFGSEFVGLSNFKLLFSGIDIPRAFRNTLLYNIASISLVSLFFGIVFALMLYEIKSHIANKIFHTCMLLPAFLSWTVISAALLILLHPDSGIANKILEAFGMQPVNWYMKKEYWPAIIMFCMIYKNAGLASVYFYSALLNIDTELFDAANLDGASRLQQIIHISLPAMSKVFCITLIMALGGVLSSTVSPFYELTFNNGALYDTTEVIGTYLYNGLGGGRYSFLTAVSLVQSVAGLILVVSSNQIVKKIDPESAMF